ncbi:MAG TPA: D-tyrosyl-tRNA(Tyr) deacylase [Anaerolineae bacterium]|nr:D-tyrosyl-tRNA(Tyr) deacylase [Anaerolineae bacterium]
MRAVLQRVNRAAVYVGEETVGAIDRGLVVLLGITHSDTAAEAKSLAVKTANLRIFEDTQGKMNLSVLDIGGSVLVVSQFTLYANARRGRRPSFTKAAPPAQAEPLVERFVAALRQAGIARVETGVFRAHMLVEIHNDGPVTIVLDSEDLR